MSDDRLTRLEELLAHQQRTVDELNAVVTTLRADLDDLRADHVRLAQTVRRLVEAYEGAEDTPGERPPHY